MSRNSTINVPEQDLQRIEKGGLFNDLIIDSYLREVERRNADRTQGYPSVLCLDTTFFTCLDNNEVGKAARRFRRVNPFDFELLLVPLHIPGPLGHWALIVAQPQQRRISSYDSLGFKHQSHMSKLFYALVRYARVNDITIAPAAWHLQDTSERGPRQANGVDCGVFVTWFCERLARGEALYPLVKPFRPDAWRKHVHRSVTTHRLATDDAMSSEFKEDDEIDEWVVLDQYVQESLSGSLPQSDISMEDLLNVLEEESIVPTEDGAEMTPGIDSVDACMTEDNGSEVPYTQEEVPSPCLSLEASEEWIDEECQTRIEPSGTNDLESNTPQSLARLPAQTNKPKRLRRRNKKRAIILPNGKKIRVPRRLLVGY